MLYKKFLILRILLITAVLMLFLHPIIRAQWVQTNELVEERVLSLAVNGTTIFAGTANGIFRSTDNGENWTAVNTGLTYYNILSLAVSGTTIFAGTEGGVFRSTDNGGNWTVVNTGLTHKYIYALAVSETMLFAGTAGDIFRSTDNGENWTSAGFDGQFITALAMSGTALFIGRWIPSAPNTYTLQCILRSTDRGNNWTVVSSSLTNQQVNALAVSETILFAAGSSNGSGILRSPDNGDNWTNAGLMNQGIRAFAMSGTTLFAAGTENGGVFRTTDNGDNWTAIGLIGQRIYALAVSGKTLFAGTYGAGVWKLDLSTTNVETDIKPYATESLIVHAYPNPSTSLTTISVSPEVASSTLEVFNIYGQKVFSSSQLSLGSSTIDIPALPIGVYSIVVNTVAATGRTKLLIIH